MIGRSPSRWRLPLVGAAIALSLSLVACGDDAPAGTTGTVGTTPVGNSSTTTLTPATGPAVDLLGAALETVGDRYAFTGTVTLNGAVVTEVTGTVYDGTGAFQVTSNDTVVDYVISDEGQWARQVGVEEWTALSGEAPLGDPLGPLATPLALTVLEENGNDALLEATYEGSTLGFSEDGPVIVTVTITGGAVSSISYNARIGDGTAVVVTSFDGAADVAPIQVPPS